MSFQFLVNDIDFSFHQVFVAFVGTMHSFGSLGALTGLIIARLKESNENFQLTKDEETWFGK